MQLRFGRFYIAHGQGIDAGSGAAGQGITIGIVGSKLLIQRQYLAVHRHRRRSWQVTLNDQFAATGIAFKREAVFNKGAPGWLKVWQQRIYLTTPNSGQFTFCGGKSQLTLFFITVLQGVLLLREILIE